MVVEAYVEPYFRLDGETAQQGDGGDDAIARHVLRLGCRDLREWRDAILRFQVEQADPIDVIRAWDSERTAFHDGQGARYAVSRRLAPAKYGGAMAISKCRDWAVCRWNFYGVSGISVVEVKR